MSVSAGTQTPLINRRAPAGSLQGVRRQELGAAMRRAEEGLRAARAGQSGQGDRATALHLDDPIFLSRPPQATTTSPSQLHLSRENSISESRKGLLEERLRAWQREADGLEVSITKLKDKPSVTGVKLLRERKDELERKALTAHSLHEDVLSSSFDQEALVQSREQGVRQRAELSRRLQDITTAIDQCENELLEGDLDEGNGKGGGSLVEKLKLPTFSGNALDYPEYKSLFNELVSTLRVTETMKMEYLRKSLDQKLLYIVRGARDRKEAWRRLDEHFADRAGSIRTVLRNLVSVDISKGKLFERLDRLKNEIEHAHYLLKGLKAEGKLAGDVELVAKLLEKLPSKLREKWVDWSTS